MMIVRPRPGSTTFLVEGGSLDYRLPGISRLVWCIDEILRMSLVIDMALHMLIWHDIPRAQPFDLKHTSSFSFRQVWQCLTVKGLHRRTWPELPLHILGNLTPNDRQVHCSGDMLNSVVGFSSNGPLFGVCSTPSA
eukprot:2304894-Amphidinium_carterae.1